MDLRTYLRPTDGYFLISPSPPPLSAYSLNLLTFPCHLFQILFIYHFSIFRRNENPEVKKGVSLVRKFPTSRFVTKKRWRMVRKRLFNAAFSSYFQPHEKRHSLRVVLSPSWSLINTDNFWEIGFVVRSSRASKNRVIDA